MDSVLAQTFQNFELIIINDGSTDDSEQIILGYHDQRIRYYANEGNKGLIFSLNKAIDLAAGRYIARMDADDICAPERLQVQKEWLDAHPASSINACHIAFMDEHDAPAGYWPLEMQTVSPAHIRQVLPRENCIAHPSVMGRSEIFRQYKYAGYQRHIEDYDLWLRLAADGKVIDKVDQVLLHYRIHGQSVTSTHLQTRNVFFKQYHCKRRFLYHRLRAGRFGSFEGKVLGRMLADGMMGCMKNIKKNFRRRT
jgi:glycosyltransferase involved in cell wall biosynthesis